MSLSNPPSGADNTGATLESLITTFIMQYDQKIKIGNRRNIEAVERHKAAIQNLIAQEANKAVVAELKERRELVFERNNGLRSMENALTSRQINTILAIFDDRIAQLTAHKESKE